MTKDQIETGTHLLKEIEFYKKSLLEDECELHNAKKAFPEWNDKKMGYWCATTLYRSDHAGKAGERVTVECSIFIKMLEESKSYKEQELIRLQKEFDQL